jgi:tagaturonate reductase
MLLSKKTIGQIRADGVEIPAGSCFNLPEKVLQFGTGVLLRGLPDYFINKANSQGVFNGRIVLVKSTTSGDSDALPRQDYLYTQCIRGIEDGKKTQTNVINASISRILNARNNWNEILQVASNPGLSLVISNTTEVGLVLADDQIKDAPPDSFPGKLLAILYHRFFTFNGDPSKGLVIIPTELIPENGKLLLSILLELSKRNSLKDSFVRWLENSNTFCNSLVDRIVPGKLPASQQTEIESRLGYQDDCMIMSESYRLWAIESSSKTVIERLSFSQTDKGVVIAPDIHIFRELKLRLLNGSHTFCCGLAVLAGFTMVKEAMENILFSSFITKLMKTEIVSAITDGELSPGMAADFADKVLDRYRNPYIEHHWLNITLQYASKMKMRNVPLVLEYIKRLGMAPPRMALGFAGHVLFMKSLKGEDGRYYGNACGKNYLVNDNHAGWYAEQWNGAEKNGLLKLVNTILANVELWGTDLSILPGFTGQVKEALESLINDGVLTVMSRLEPQPVTG